MNGHSWYDGRKSAQGGKHIFIQIDKDIYEKLSETEKGVIQFLNQNEKKIPYMNITNITERTLASQSAVFRATQKRGYQGISQLRYAVSQQEQMEEHRESSCGVNNILAKSYRESTKMIDSTSPIAMLETIEHIKQVRCTFISARGFTALVIEESQMYLQLLGYNAIIVKDVKWIENVERIVIKDDTAFILPLRNSTPELVRSARATRMKGAKVITCCCKFPCEPGKFSGITVYGHFEQIMEVSGITVYSRIPLLIIIKTVIEYIG